MAIFQPKKCQILTIFSAKTEYGGCFITDSRVAILLKTKKSCDFGQVQNMSHFATVMGVKLTKLRIFYDWESNKQFIRLGRTGKR